MKCNRCGANMVMKPPTMIYTSNPPQWDEILWCACGNIVNNGRVYGKTPEEQLRDDWNKINPTESSA